MLFRSEHNIRTIALAAIKLAHDAENPEADEAEIPDAQRSVERRPREPRRDVGREGQRGGGAREPVEQGETGYLFVGLGRKAGMRPGDLVGAIANESGLSGRQIGPIRIADSYSVVGVPEVSVEAVIAAMRHVIIRGKKTTVRRYTD